MKNVHGLAILLLAGALVSCQKETNTDTVAPGKATVTLVFKAVVDSMPLAFNTEYRNRLDEPYSVSTFKFYICKLSLVNSASGTIAAADDHAHYLVDAGDPASTAISFQVDPGEYDHLAFIIGVDSASNVSGAQTGALDPAKGMFWTWNSGYIMAKLEGSSPLSTEPNNKIEYHIGGFKGPENVVKQVQLSFPVTEANKFTAGGSSGIIVTANVNAWFHKVNVLSLAANPVCMTPGELARMMAENYAGMFNLVEVSH